MNKTVSMKWASHSAIWLTIVIGAVLIISVGLVIYASAMRTTVNVSSAVMTSPEMLTQAALNVTGNEASDYFQRHPEVLKPANALSQGDYFLRHPNTSIASVSAEASDYFQRHPNTTIASVSAKASDYFQRHPELLNRATAVSQDDYFLRHPMANVIGITGERYVESNFER